MEAKILSPSKPSECAAAVSMSEDDAEHPYASVFYTAHEGRIRFFGLAVTGTKTVEEGKLLTYGGDNTDPDKATPIISGVLERGTMEIDAEGDTIYLGDMNVATTFVSLIRMVYSMEAHGA